MKSGVYEIRNIRTGDCYIGSSVNLDRRWKLHKQEFRRAQHHNRHLQSAWDKYGADAFVFTVLLLCPPSDLLLREQELLDSMSPEYNICQTAGSCLGRVPSDEHRAALSRARIGRIVAPFTKEHIANLSAALKGRNLSEVQKHKISVANRGHKRNVGRKATREQRSNMTLSNHFRKQASLSWMYDFSTQPVKVVQHEPLTITQEG